MCDMLAVDRMKIVVRSCGFMILIQNKNCKFTPLSYGETSK